MKKYILSFLMIGTFGLYILYQHVGDSSDVAIPPTIQTKLPIDTLSQTTSSNTPPPDRSTTLVATKTPVIIKTPAPVSKPIGQYKDGTYTGISADAYYGYIQVAAIISGGKLTDVQFLDYPQDRRTSIIINTRAMPYLRQEAIQAQSANVSTVSGASDSSGAFRQSLASALNQAKNS